MFKLLEEKYDEYWTKRKHRNKSLECAKQARIAAERTEEKSDKKDEKKDIKVDNNPSGLELEV